MLIRSIKFIFVLPLYERAQSKHPEDLVFYWNAQSGKAFLFITRIKDSCQF